MDLPTVLIKAHSELDWFENCGNTPDVRFVFISKELVVELLSSRQWETTVLDFRGNVNMSRCEICGLWKIEKTEKCPECNGIMDLVIEGLSLSWKCRNCDYGIATTANKLCYWDGKKYPKECYEKSSECPYAEQ